MALRNRIPDSRAIYPDPEFGVNLGVAQEDLKPGEAAQMQNAVFRGGTRTRLGSSRITSSALQASKRIRGGTKYYYGTNSSKRLVAYGQHIDWVEDDGTAHTLTSSLTDDKDTFFSTWSITDKVYIANKTDELQEYDGTTFQPVKYVGDIDIVSGTYQWTVSGSGTNEYYCELNGSGDPSLSEPRVVVEGGQAGSDMTLGTLGSLNAGEYGYGDNDSLGYSTIYVRVTSGGPDPDTDPSDLWARYSKNIPGESGNAAPQMMTPVLDRLLIITSNGIERSNPRVANIFSKNSTWATFRPSLVGPFTAVYPYSTRDTSGSFVQGAVAFQANAHYLITGTDFGGDVTASSAPSENDASIRLMDPNVGTSSPYSVASVPGIGLFWFTSDINVFWLPFGGTVSGRMIGDKISSVTSIDGIESITLGSIDQVWMAVYDRFLRLGIPTSGNTYGDEEWWLDLKKFIIDPNNPVWYGPMQGRTISRCWAEKQAGDNKLVGGEGNPTTGAFLYTLDASGVYSDAVGTSDNDISYQYQTYFKSFGSAGREKYIRSVEVDANQYSGSATMDVTDLEGASASDLAISAVT